MPAVELVFYRDDDGSVPEKDIETAIQRSKNYASAPAKHRFEEEKDA